MHTYEVHIYEVHLHCSDVTAMHKECMCLVASRDVKLSMLKCIDLREKGKSLIDFLSYIVLTAVTKRSTLHILYIKMPSDKTQAINHDDGTRCYAQATQGRSSETRT